MMFKEILLIVMKSNIDMNIISCSVKYLFNLFYA